MKVLIAEDEQSTRMRLQRNLEKLGFQPTAVENGAEAWEQFQTGEFSLVLTDWMMPKMDGLELIRHIRCDGQSQFAYIIMLTSKSETSEIVEGMEAGADDFVTKPFDRNELRVRVRAGQRIVELERTLSDQNQRMKTDLNAAAELQESLLPSETPQVDDVDFAWTFRPCDELAGDILGAFKLDEQHVGFYVADVSGHGVAASLLSVSISRMMSPTASQSSLLVQAADDAQQNHITAPNVVLRELNRRFPMEESGGRFFSIVYGVLHVPSRKLLVASAGHPPVMRLSASREIKPLEAEGMLIGIIDDYEYESCEVILNPGDRLFAYSDGVVEQLGDNDEEFGDPRLIEIISATGSNPLPDAIRSLEDAVVDWSPGGRLNDDLSILALQLK